MRALVFAACTVIVVSSHAAATPYEAGEGRCAGLPRLALDTARGWCVGIVIAGLRFPRGVVELPDRTLIVAEMGGWDAGRGRISRVTLTGTAAGPGATRVTLFDRVDRPHGVTIGPDGLVYVAIATGVFRFDPRQPSPAAEDVIGGRAALPALPSTGRHPLKKVAFASDGSLWIGVGSSTDHCENADGTPPPRDRTCRDEVDGRASLLRYPMKADAHGWDSPVIVAHGLRNPISFDFAADGAMWFADNGRDAIELADPGLSDDRLPHDTLDRLVPGGHYGWPYCFDGRRSSPEYPDHDCRRHAQPAMLLPPHAAPLGMAFVRDAPPPLAPGALVIAYHGYRAAGHRVVAFLPRAAGGYDSRPIALIAGWSASASHRLGAPVDIRPARGGSFFVTEDRNGTLLRLSPTASR